MTKQTFIVTQSERKTMINFIYKNLERPDYVPSMLEYRVWLNEKSVTQLCNLVINACEIIEINCAAGSLAWQDAIEKFPKIFDNSCDMIDAEYQLKQESIAFNAQLESPNFSFSAYGRTEAQAKKSLIHGLREHAIYYSIRRDWWMEFADDIIVIELEINACYRDGALWRRGDGSK